MLLSQWVSHCPGAVGTLLRVGGAASWLVTQTAATDHDDNEALLQGLAAFLLALCLHFNDDSVENYTKVKTYSLANHGATMRMGSILWHRGKL